MAYKKVYLEYLEEFKSFGIAKSQIAELNDAHILPDIRFHKYLYENTSPECPTVGFLLGQDKSADGTEYYTIGQSYAQSVLAIGAEIKFLDYDNAYRQMKECDGVILPGGFFDNPESFYVDGKDMGAKEGKRFFAYKSVIQEAYAAQKPMLGICAGAQMIGAILGNMKMYRSIEQEIPQKTVHKPRQETDVRVHGLKLLPGMPMQKIMGLAPEEDRIMINSRHAQAMVHPAMQDYIKGKPLVKMDMYAVSDADGVPEIWGNASAGILCVQGHPEDLAAAGDEKMLNIYRHIAGLSSKYKKAHSLPRRRVAPLKRQNNER